ncbi:hypothetical protein BHE74_00028918 [Ensete ventricosum]|nr:hypothetical protein BHE74_00028918 [Ensete ventricosum]
MATAAAVVPEVYARDAMIAWFRGEFAAANAIIDALCSHLAQIGGAAEYEPVFAAVHRRRLNWIPVLHMQKYYSIAEVAAELRVVAANREAASFASAAEDPTEAKQLVATPEEDKPVESGGAQAEEEHPASEESAVDGVGMAVEEEAAAEEEPATAEAEADDGVQVAVVEEAAADEVSSDHKGTEEGDAKGGNDRPHRSQIRVTPHWSNLLSSSSGYIAVFEVDQTALMDHSLFAVRFQRRSPRPRQAAAIELAYPTRPVSRFTDRGIEVLILGPREVFDSRFRINLLVWDYGEGSLQDGHVLHGMGSTLTRKP